MKFLFVHHSFPGPFHPVACDLARDGTHGVGALHLCDALPNRANGVFLFGCASQRAPCPDIHPWLQTFERQIIRGETAFRVALGLRAAGFDPDLIVGRASGGEMLFLRDAWPKARIALQCDLPVADPFDEDGASLQGAVDPLLQGHLRMSRLHLDMTLDAMDAGYAPTVFHAARFAPPIAERLSILPPGVDTQRFSPATPASQPPEWLRPGCPVLTIEADALQTGEGLHRLLQALPGLVAADPEGHLVIVAGDGAAGPGHARQGRAVTQILSMMDPSERQRVHIVGAQDAAGRLRLLRHTTLYLHLSRALPLPLSVLEAMSVGACVVATDGEPARDVLTDGVDGRLVDAGDAKALVDCVATMLRDRPLCQRLGAAGRTVVETRFDLARIAVPRARRWLETEAGA